MRRDVFSPASISMASALLLLGGCNASPGSRSSCEAADGGHTDGEIPVDPLCPNACDDDAARAVVYDAAGRAMYAGQAMITGSCAGGGNFCHSSTALDRYGVPAGLDFDAFPLRVAANTNDDEGLRALVRAQATIHRNRSAIWGTVVNGSMPPGGAGDTVEIHNYGWVTDPSNLDSDQPMADLDTLEGREILRNWLACGSPVIERWTTTVATDCTTNADCASGLCTAAECEPAGDVVSRLERPLLPNWRSIFLQVIEPNCVTPGCHAPDPGNGNAISAGLDLTDFEMSRAALVGIEAAENSDTTGAVCGGTGAVRIVVGDPDNSLFVNKLENETPDCGDQMPFGQPLDAAQIAVIREWITMGACLMDCSLPDTAMNATATCVDEVCGLTCAAGFRDADGDRTNGCEAAM